MKEILHMTLLGMIAGMLSGFLTRIIKRNMIFRDFGELLIKVDSHSWIMSGRGSVWVKFIRCVFCLQVWICFGLVLFYIIEFNPWWLYAVIGVMGGLGAGNFIAEIINALRNEQ